MTGSQRVKIAIKAPNFSIINGLGCRRRNDAAYRRLDRWESLSTGRSWEVLQNLPGRQFPTHEVPMGVVWTVKSIVERAAREFSEQIYIVDVEFREACAQ
jgi:hypothetical protein